ncbi:hypothetical protein BACEGG_02801 [Bacteroides eggerthii DSM 20697]|nr:hypothetical protein BACEGG_02801 [Bacteroides eggerthii DSM 20697]
MITPSKSKRTAVVFIVSMIKTNIIFSRKGLNNHRTEQIFPIFADA